MSPNVMFLKNFQGVFWVSLVLTHFTPTSHARDGIIKNGGLVHIEGHLPVWMLVKLIGPGIRRQTGPEVKQTTPVIKSLSRPGITPDRVLFVTCLINSKGRLFRVSQ